MNIAKMLIALIACASLLFAGEAAAPAPAKAANGAKKESSIAGTVVSVDAIANSIIVKVKKAEDTLSVETGAKVLSGKKEIPLGDLKADAKVTVTCKTVDGKKVATRIVEKAAAPAAPKAGKAEKKTEAAPAAAPAAEPAAAPAAK
ncbi:MAG TPA: hypothetical protein VLX68_12300 [Chitinivibrionales bacterium]|nr:hypothetical protein [Chitinivibrionales bacterium]